MTNHIIGDQDTTQSTMNHKLVPMLLVVQLSYAWLPFSLQSKYKYVANTTLAPLKPNLILNCVTKWPFLGIEDFYDFSFMGKSKIFFTMDVTCKYIFVVR